MPNSKSMAVFVGGSDRRGFTLCVKWLTPMKTSHLKAIMAVNGASHCSEAEPAFARRLYA